MKMWLAAMLGASMAIAGGGLSAAQDRTAFSDPALGIAFVHAGHREVRPCPDLGETCVAIFDGEDQLMALRVFDGALDAVAASEAGFEENDAGVLMTTYGRFEPVPVETFDGPGWTGLKATVTCGIEDETGFHAAGGECLWAVVSDGRRSVVATTDGILGLDVETQASLASLRFLGAR